MTEKQQIRDHIREGASIVEGLENADIEQLRKEGENELADLIEKMLTDVDLFAEALDLFNDEDQE